jgi:hypothetical protein
LDGQGSLDTPPFAPISLHGELTLGEASDLDGHLLRYEGVAIWISNPGDCYHGKTSANWGVPGGDDAPGLDIDDTNGFGPENINIASMEPGVE